MRHCALAHVADALAGDRLRVGRVVEHLDRHPAARSSRPAAPGRSARSRCRRSRGRGGSGRWRGSGAGPSRVARGSRPGAGAASADIAFTSRCSHEVGWPSRSDQLDALGGGVDEVGLRPATAAPGRGTRRRRRAPAAVREACRRRSRRPARGSRPAGMRRCAGEPKTRRSPPRSRQQRASSTR